MNNKMVINIYLSTTESKKRTKQTKRTETESWILSVLMAARWEEMWGKGEEVRGLRSTNR